jgi:beta-galactosidase/beta-glucuronidase
MRSYPPITGDHTFQGGLYRDVNVVVTDPLHITWYGTWVTTPTLATNAGSSSTVQIKTEVQNSRSAAVQATLKTDIVDKDGKVPVYPTWSLSTAPMSAGLGRATMSRAGGI